MKDYNKLTTRSTNYLKNNPKPTPKKMPKKNKCKNTPKSKAEGAKKAKKGPMEAPLTNQKAAGGGRVILSQDQWHNLICTGISESIDANMKNQEAIASHNER